MIKGLVGKAGELAEPIDYGEVTVTIHEGKNLPNMDKSLAGHLRIGSKNDEDEKSDAYVIYSLPGLSKQPKEARTKTVISRPQMGQDPKWGEAEKFQLCATVDKNPSAVLELVVMDKDAVKDELIGKARVPLQTLAISKSMNQWVDLTTEKGTVEGKIRVGVSYRPPSKKEASPTNAGTSAAVSAQGMGEPSVPALPPPGQEGDSSAPVGKKVVSAEVDDDDERGAIGPGPLPGKSLPTGDRYGGNEWQVRVHVIQARGLQSDNDSKPIEAFTKVRFQRESKTTKIQESSGPMPYFDEEFSFTVRNPNNLFWHENFMVDVYDQGRFHLGSTRLGGFSFEIKNIYTQPGHEYYRRWVALTRGNGDWAVRGYLQITVMVIGPQDDFPDHDDEDDHEDDSMDNVLQPKRTALQQIHLVSRVYRAEDLPRMDISLRTGVGVLDDVTGTKGKESCDPFIRVSFGGSTSDTTTLMETYRPEWHQYLYLPMSVPSFSGFMKLEVWDYDGTNGNDVIATQFLDMNTLTKFGSKLPDMQSKWIHLYGAPKIFRLMPAVGLMARYNNMNHGETEGSHYRGRVLLGIEGKPVKEGGNNLMLNIPEHLRPRFTVCEFDLTCELLFGAMLPADKLKVEVSIGEYFQQSSCVRSAAYGGRKWDDAAKVFDGQHRPKDNLSIQWFEELRVRSRWEVTPGADGEPDVVHVPDIVLTLMNEDGDYLAFARIDANELLAKCEPPSEMSFADPTSASWQPTQEGPFVHIRLPNDHSSNKESGLELYLGSSLDELLECPGSVATVLRDTAGGDPYIQDSGRKAAGNLRIFKFTFYADSRKLKAHFGNSCAEVFLLAEVPVFTLPAEEISELIITLSRLCKRAGVIFEGLRSEEDPKPLQSWQSHTWESTGAQAGIPVTRFLTACDPAERTDLAAMKGMLCMRLELTKDEKSAVLNRKGRFDGPSETDKSWEKEYQAWKRMKKAEDWKKEGFFPPQPTPEVPSKLFTSRSELPGADDMIEYTFRAYILKMRGLLPGDGSGVSDPYVRVMLADGVAETNYVEKTLNPYVNETVEFGVTLPNPKRFPLPPVVIEVWDNDLLGSNTFLGRTTYQLLNVDQDEKPPKLEWLPLEVPKNGGDVLCSFQLLPKEAAVAGLLSANASNRVPDPTVRERRIPDDMSSKMARLLIPKNIVVRELPQSIIPPSEPMVLDIFVLGFRKMLPYLLIDIKKPLVEFEIDEKVIHSASGDGPDCNILQRLTLRKLMLPKQRKYLGSLSVKVYDQRYFGQRVLVASVPIELEDITVHSGWFTGPDVKPPNKLDQAILPPNTNGKSTTEMPGETVESVSTASSHRRKLAAVPKRSIRFDPSTTDVTKMAQQPMRADTIRHRPGTSLRRLKSSGAVTATPRGTREKMSWRKKKECYELDYESDYDDEEHDVKVSDDIFDGLAEDEDEVPEIANTSNIQGAADAAPPGVELAETGGSTLRARKRTGANVTINMSGLEELSDSEMYSPWLRAYLKSKKKKERSVALYHKGLEHHFGGFDDTFKSYQLYRGDVHSQKEAGLLKGNVVVYPESWLDRDNTPDICNLNKDIDTKQYPVKVRVYILRATKLRPMDGTLMGATSDPYLSLHVGKGGKSKPSAEIVDNAEERIKWGQLEPEFMQSYELDATLPEDAELKVCVWDFDRVGYDDLIGYTVINLEDRWFSRRFRRDFQDNTEANPNVLDTWPYACHIERRSLVNPEKHGEALMGRIDMWVDIVRVESIPRNYLTMVDIALPPTELYELRAIIWMCKNVPLQESNIAGEKMTDIYVKGFLKGTRDGIGKELDTEVHYRSKNGEGIFNWRFKFPLGYVRKDRKMLIETDAPQPSLFSTRKMPKAHPPVLTLQIWDNDLLPGMDDYIGEVHVPLDRSMLAATNDGEITPAGLFTRVKERKTGKIRLRGEQQTPKRWYKCYTTTPPEKSSWASAHEERSCCWDCLCCKSEKRYEKLDHTRAQPDSARPKRDCGYPAGEIQVSFQLVPLDKANSSE
eukprot:Sspe_Gene.33266::Locus_16253_Transcript_1_1_Confidence_1.000_Length_6061::g.33266::m.33266